jgi:2-polyprenyl-6-methoxyphenol hydroxylase-like FAD-dependent oxidoreductase
VGAFATGTLASPQGRELPVGIASFDQSAAVSPTTVAGVPQDHLEAVLLEHLRRFPAAKVRFGTELVSFDQDTDGVTVVLRTLMSGREPVVRADRLVGADGAHSRVRDGLGIAMDGPDHLGEHLTVLFEAPLRELVGDRRYGIYFIEHPEAGGIFVPNGTHNRWLYGRAWQPRRERLEDYTDTRLTALIRGGRRRPRPARAAGGQGGVLARRPGGPALPRRPRLPGRRGPRPWLEAGLGAGRVGRAGAAGQLRGRVAADRRPPDRPLGAGGAEACPTTSPARSTPSWHRRCPT